VRAHRGSAKGTPAADVVVQSAAADLRASVVAALVDAKRDGTPAGQMCLLLADQAMAADARALPGLSRELSLRLAEALRGAQAAVADPVDELRERRERRGVA
jgi:hypothetical protein